MYSHVYSSLLRAVVLVLTLAAGCLSLSAAEVTRLSYQGMLTDSGRPADGIYDLQLALYDDPALGSQIGVALTNENVVVTRGLFTTSLDFGSGPFSGAPRWLHVGVRLAGSGAGFQPLFPRQPLLAAPYAVRAVNADRASRADQADAAVQATSAGRVAWAGLTDVPSGFADGIDHDTTYAAGVGLSLAGNVFSLAPSGVTATQLANGAVNSTKLADGAALAEISDDDGPGSGLNADLLDGLDSTALAPRLNPAFTGRVTAERLAVTDEFLVETGFGSGVFKVHSSGGISVGTTNRFFSSPSAMLVASTLNVDDDLQISRGTNAYRMVTSAAGNFELWWQRLRTNGASGTQRLILTTNGLVGIGVVDPEFRLHVNGTAGKPGGGSWSVASDVRLKRNIQAIRGALDQLLQLHGVHFEYANPELVHELAGQRTGLIAQEVEKVFPDWVETGPDGFKRLTVRGFEALVIEALREMRAEKQSRIEALERDLAELKAAVARLARPGADRPTPSP